MFLDLKFFDDFWPKTFEQLRWINPSAPSTNGPAMDWGQGPPPGPGWGQGPPPGPGWDGPPPPSPGWGNPGDVEYVEEQRPGSKMANALPMCCLGILLWPVSLCLLGWNEVNYVCKHKSILYGQKMAEVIGCEPRSNWYQDMVVYMSCPIHEDSLQVFTLQALAQEVCKMQSLLDLLLDPNMLRCINV